MFHTLRGPTLRSNGAPPQSWSLGSQWESGKMMDSKDGPGRRTRHAPWLSSEIMSDTVMMDAHTLELLEFNKVRELLAGYGACSLGKDLARQVEPFTDPERIRANVALVTEMVSALQQGQSPPFGGLHDVRLLARRAAIGAMLGADQLLEVADTLA